jgi:hypothetical protein
MTTKLIDCNDDPVKEIYTPWGAACWWLKPLPATLQADIGPVVVPTCDPLCLCYDFPTTGSVRVQFNRVTKCDWESGVMVWQCSAFDYPLTLFINTFEKIYQNNPNISPISNVFSFSGDPNPTGSCNYNFTTGKTSGTISGVATIPPQGCSCAGCLLSYVVYFDETL